jgi:hypothetical protein
MRDAEDTKRVESGGTFVPTHIGREKMSEAKGPNFVELQKIASSTFGAIFTNPALMMMLRVQSNMLASLEFAVTEWIHHRRDALADTERVLVGMQTCQDPAELWGLQKEWLRQTLQRLASDAANGQRIVMSLAASSTERQDEQDEGKQASGQTQQGAVTSASSRRTAAAGT